jgi:putative lipoic acid-binding regulatory protein
MSEREETLRVLNEGHTFPGPYMFKVIGENSPEFAAHVIQAATVICGLQAAPEVSVRESAGGKHQAVTISIAVESAEQVLEIYAAFRAVGGVRMVF